MARMTCATVLQAALLTVAVSAVVAMDELSRADADSTDLPLRVMGLAPPPMVDRKDSIDVADLKRSADEWLRGSDDIFGPDDDGELLVRDPGRRRPLRGATSREESLRRMDHDPMLGWDPTSDDDEPSYYGMDDEVSVSEAELENAPHPAAWPPRAVSSVDLFGAGDKTCTQKPLCQSAFSDVFTARASELVEAGESKEAALVSVCGNCLRFLCCTDPNSYTFSSSVFFTSYESDASKACSAKCAYLRADLDVLETETKKEGSTATGPNTYLAQYLRMLSHVNIRPLIKDGQFETIRQLPRSLNVGQSVALADKMASIPDEDYTVLLRGRDVLVRKVTISGTDYVVKSYQIPTKDIPENLVKDIGANELLRSSDNPHITHFFGFYYTIDGDDMYYRYVNLVFEYCPYTLDKLYYERGDDIARNPKLVQNIMAQLVVGLRILSINRIAHRDLKLENIFLGRRPPSDRPLELGDVVVKIGDFDRAVHWGRVSEQGASGDSPLDRYRKIYGPESMSGPLLEEEDKYPTDFTSLSYMPPEALAAAAVAQVGPEEFAGIMDEGRYWDAVSYSNFLPIVSQSRWVPKDLDAPIVRSRLPLEGAEKAEMLSPHVLEKYDAWMIGVIVAELASGVRLEKNGEQRVEWFMWRYKHFLRLYKARMKLEHKKATRKICHSSSPAESSHAICLILAQLHLRAFVEVGEERILFKNIPASKNDEEHELKSQLIQLLWRIFDPKPQSRAGGAEMSESRYLSDAVADAEKAMHQYASERAPVSPAGSLDASSISMSSGSIGMPPDSPFDSTLQQWRQCSMLSYASSGSPSSPSADSMVSDEYDPSVYSSSYYFEPNDSTAGDLPMTVPLTTDRVRDVFNEGRSSAARQVILRSERGVPNTLAPLADLDIPDRMATIEGLRMSRVQYIASKAELDKFFTKHAESYLWSVKPPKVSDAGPFGYLVAILRVKIRTPDNMVVRAEAYDSTRFIAGTPEDYWTETCTGKTIGTDWSAFAHPLDGSGRAARGCPSRPENMWLEVPMVVEPGRETVSEWSIRLRLRTVKIPGELCYETKISSPLNVLDTRWNTETGLVGLGDNTDEEVRSSMCYACSVVWAKLVQREVYRVKSSSSFSDDGISACPTRVRNRNFCYSAERDLTRLIMRIPTRERRLLLSMGPEEGCSVLTQNICTDHAVPMSRLTDYLTKGVTNVCADVDEFGHPSMDGDDNELQMCPKVTGETGFDYPNVVPSKAPEAWYRPWLDQTKCAICQYLAMSVDNILTNTDEDMCQPFRNTLAGLGHNVFARMRDIWGPHYPLHQGQRRGLGLSSAEDEDHYRPENALLAVENAGKLALSAESSMCTMPWEERQQKICLALQAHMRWLHRTKKEVDAKSVCRKLACCKG